MDPMLIGLATSAATSIVHLLTKDGWAKLKNIFAEHLDENDAEPFLRELETSREDLLRARRESDDDAQLELESEWKGRLRRRLLDDESASLRAALEEIVSLSDGLASSDSYTLHAKASGHGQIYQQGKGFQQNF